MAADGPKGKQVGFAGRTVRRWRKSLFKRRRDPVIGTVGGVRLLLDPRHRYDKSLYVGDVAEAAQVARMEAIAADWRPDVFLDIGANLGFYALRLALAGVAEVHAFEPIGAVFHQMCANIFLNGLDRRIHAHRCALGEAAGIATIAIDPDTPDVSTLDRDNIERQWNFAESEQIAVRRLDDFGLGAGRKCLIKIDVEGFEMRTLQGMRGLLADNECFIQIEVFEKNRDAVRGFMAEAGLGEAGAIGNDHYFGPK